MFLTSILACGIYFRKRRALANGLAMCGSGVGVFILSPILEWLLTIYDWDGTVLILAGFALNGCVVAALYRPLPLILQKEEPPIVTESGDSGIEPIAPADVKEPDETSQCLPPSEGPICPKPPPSSITRTGSLSRALNRQLLLVKGANTSNSASHLPVPFIKSNNNLSYKSSTSIYRSTSNYWDNVHSAQLSHLDLCQIGSMLTIPTVYSMNTLPVTMNTGLGYSTSLITIEEYNPWPVRCRSACMKGLWSIHRMFSIHLLTNPIMALLIAASVLWTGTWTFLICET